MKNIVKYVGKEEYQRVKKFFEAMDSDYYPALSEREDGLENHLEKSFSKNGKMVVFERNGKLIGAFGFCFENSAVNCEIIGVETRYRRSPVAYRMIEYAVEQEQHASINKIVARTWSTNQDMISLLEALGFEKVKEIEGDMVPKRTSCIYEADPQDIMDFFGR